MEMASRIIQPTLLKNLSDHLLQSLQAE